MPIRLVTAAALLGGGYLIARQMTRRPSGRGRGTEPQKTQDPTCLSDVFLTNALWSPSIVARLGEHNIQLLASPQIDAEAQEMAFDTALALIPQVQGDAQDPARDQVIQAALEVISPTCYWDERLRPYAVGSRQFTVWEGVGRVHDLARALLEAQGDI